MTTTVDLVRAIQRSGITRQGVDIADVRVGSRVVIRSGFGSEPAETVTLEGVDADIKNGRPGCDYTDSKGDGRWAYLSQVVRVVEY
jgi:hypothetical protein